MAFNGNAQNFKVIEETKDYILKECDSGYYYSHGLPPKDDFVIDTTKIHKVNGVLKLPLDNGKEVVFRDEGNEPNYMIRKNSYGGKNRKWNYFLVNSNFYDEGGFSLLINSKNGATDTVFDKPVFSPNAIHYGYDYSSYMGGDIYVCYKNLNQNKAYKILMEDLAPMNIKWLNDYSFIFIGNLPDFMVTKYKHKKYYLVQIKQ